MSNPFYPPEDTALSLEVLSEVLAVAPQAIRIGGWSTWLRVGGDMSHDIDLIVTQADMTAIGRHAQDMSESRHIAQRKWRAIWRGIHLDMYVPYQSLLGGRLELRVEGLAEYAETVDRRRLLTVDAHIATKMAAVLGRPQARPGQKDRAELRKLFRISSGTTPAVLLDVSRRAPADLAALVTEAFGYIGEVPGLSRGDRNELRSMEAAWVRVLRGGAR